MSAKSVKVKKGASLRRWQELPSGGLILEPGNSVAYETGAWRVQHPVIDLEKCTHCMFCWIFCPEGCIQTKDSRVLGVDLRYCKGCGICAVECPRKVITMVEETEAEKGA